MGFLEFLPPNEVFPKAKAAAANALRLRPSLAEAHSALGLIKFAFEWDWSGAEEELKRGIDLDPDSGIAHQDYAIFTGNLGRVEASISHRKIALRSNPLEPFWSVDLAYYYCVSGNYEEALARIRETTALAPNYHLAYWGLGNDSTGSVFAPVEVLDFIASRPHAPGQSASRTSRRPGTIAANA